MVFQSRPAKLIAILQVEKTHRVQCQQPGCGQGIFKAIHVIDEDGKLMVLGSTCFAVRFGKSNALGPPRYGGGHGRPLTEEERLLLTENTEALIELLESERQTAARAAQEKLASMREVFDARKKTAVTSSWQSIEKQTFGIPWSWVKPMTSIAYFRMKDGTAWVRVQHQNGLHVLMPWPSFSGWDETFPTSVGIPDPDLGGLKVSNIAETVSYLRIRANSMHVGIWKDVIGLTKGISR